MTTINPRSITPSEAPYMPERFEDLAHVADLLEQAGHSHEFARNCIGWLALKAAGMKDRSSPRTRSDYRKALAALNAELPGPRRRSQAGLADVLAVAGVTATAAVGAATKDPRAAALAVPALVYITYTVGEDEIVPSPGVDSLESAHTLCALPRRDIPTSYTLPAAA